MNTKAEFEKALATPRPAVDAEPITISAHLAHGIILFLRNNAHLSECLAAHATAAKATELADQLNDYTDLAAVRVMLAGKQDSQEVMRG